jgi:hypothetical protein
MVAQVSDQRAMSLGRSAAERFHAWSPLKGKSWIAKGSATKLFPRRFTLDKRVTRLPYILL